MPKILIVEDDAAMLSLLTTLLEIERFQVMKPKVMSPEALKDQIATECPDVILMDVYLRQFNGLDLLKMIKQDQQGKSLRVIMSSGMDFSEECLRAGANSFIMKPYMPDDLINNIHQVLSGA